MKRKIVSALLLVSSTLIYAQKFEKITIAEKEFTETFHEKYEIEDNYRWLENVDDEIVKEWVKQQNKLSNRYLETCSRKTNAFRAIGMYDDNEYEYHRPFKKGTVYFGLHSDNHLKEKTLYFQPSRNNDWVKIVDPTYIKGEGRARIKSYSANKEGKYAAYLYSRDGGDWREARIFDLKRRIHLDETLKDLKFTSTYWAGDGFYYKKFPRKSRFDVSEAPQIYFHKIGTSQEEDKLIFERKNKPHIQLSLSSVYSERYLFIEELDEQKGTVSYYYFDHNEEVPRIRPLARNLKVMLSVLGENPSNGDLIVSVFDEKTEKTIIVAIDLKNPRNWKEIVPAYENSNFISAEVTSNGILVVFKENLRSVLTFYNFQGEIKYSDPQPLAATVSRVMEGETDKDILYTITSYTVPNVMYELNTENFKKELNQKTTVTFNAKNIKYKEIMVPTRDGKKVPAIMVYDSEKIEEGKANPTLIETYGGFGVQSNPYFKPEVVHFVKKGGIYINAYVRGTGGFGQDWIDGGKRLNKQNTINDLIDVSEYLISEKITSNDLLAIKGGSHGGFVVAAASVQRPDLYKAVVSDVPVIDMLRFEEFSVGQYHIDEFGSIKTEVGFNNLKSISPYHNIIEDVNYPATLIVTSDNDQRVPPFHSYKYAAKLLGREAQTNPILLKVEKNAGHYGGTNEFRGVKDKADSYGFIMHTLGM
ncbi:prolyl oligopeptidase family serine peptidase [Aureivirga sp. CE67]|uniref:prolyl oligopeptidase family serine peptidase n=1 Tax=Aureivirga sp. CE67 TaxID=1788983 RepID=UPI0018CB76FC|nr:prolyl oligopeptidase family serine peptidase [Aureivirga sp. CE67]